MLSITKKTFEDILCHPPGSKNFPGIYIFNPLKNLMKYTTTTQILQIHSLRRLHVEVHISLTMSVQIPQTVTVAF